MKATHIHHGITALTLCLLLAACASSSTTQSSVNTSTTGIQGAWEIRKDGILWAISFIDDTFAVFRDGKLYQDGLYTLEPSTWGVTVTSNHPRNVYMEFGLERDFQGLAYDISDNELVLSDAGWTPISRSGYLSALPLGAYRRGLEPSEAGNPLIGVWRIDYKNDAGKDETQVFRFFPNGNGVLLTFTRQRSKGDGMAGIIDFTYEFGTTPRTGQISLLQHEFISGPPWIETTVFRVLPLVIDDNVLRLEGITAEYRKS